MKCNTKRLWVAAAVPVILALVDFHGYSLLTSLFLGGAQARVLEAWLELAFAFPFWYPVVAGLVAGAIGGPRSPLVVAATSAGSVGILGGIDGGGLGLSLVMGLLAGFWAWVATSVSAAIEAWRQKRGPTGDTSGL